LPDRFEREAFFEKSLQEGSFHVHIIPLRPDGKANVRSL